MVEETKVDPNSIQAEPQQLGETLIAALAARDFATLTACFHPAVRFRALIPPGVREATTARDTIALLRRWFGGADRLELLAGEAEALADRLHLRYRFLIVDANSRQLVEQQGYGDVREGKLVRLDLLCSGFRPLSTTNQGALPVAATLDATGETCATLTPLIQKRMRAMTGGEVLVVRADEPEARAGIPAWSRLTGNTLLATVDDGMGGTRFFLRKK